MALARIGLGSNQGESAGLIARAVERLREFGEVTAVSSLYRSKAWGVTSQPDFINAAALLQTRLGPRELLAALVRLEAELGRVRTYRWGPRVIDLDILAYDDLRLNEPDLVIPHPRLAERAFALVPLAEIDPAFIPARDRLGVGALAEVEPYADPNRAQE